MALTKVTQDMVDFTVGGGGMPKTEIFTSSGTWLVPQEVQDKIASDGYATVGLFMVGGGSLTSENTRNSGEIVNKTIKLTASDYDPQSEWASSTQPEISVSVGGDGGNSGFTYSPLSNTSVLNEPFNLENPSTPVANTVFRTHTAYHTLTQTPQLDSNGYPYVSEIKLGIRNYSGLTPNPPSYSAGFGFITRFSNFTTNPSIPAFTADGVYIKVVISYSTPTPFDGTVTIDPYWVTGSSSGAAVLQISYDTAVNKFKIFSTTDSTSGNNGIAQFNGSGTTASTFTYNRGETFVRVARSGSSTSVNDFLNNPQSVDGYFGGFSRYVATGTTTTPNSGQPGQSGYVQIYF